MYTFNATRAASAFDSVGTTNIDLVSSSSVDPFSLVSTVPCTLNQFHTLITTLGSNSVDSVTMSIFSDRGFGAAGTISASALFTSYESLNYTGYTTAYTSSLSNTDYRHLPTSSTAFTPTVTSASSTTEFTDSYADSHTYTVSTALKTSSTWVDVTTGYTTATNGTASTTAHVTRTGTYSSSTVSTTDEFITSGVFEVVEGTFTTSAQMTISSTSFVAFTLTGPVEIGTVIVAGDEWLWSASAAGDLSFISGLGDSFTRTTLWPSYYASSFFTISNAADPVNGDLHATSPGYAFTATTESIGVGIGGAGTVTSGDFFSRDTTAGASTSSTSSASGAVSTILGGATTTCFTTQASTFSTTFYSSVQLTTLVPGGYNNTTATVSALTTSAGTSSFVSFFAGDEVCRYRSSSSSGTRLVAGDRELFEAESSTYSEACTSILQTAYSLNPAAGGTVSVFNTVNGAGEMRAPSPAMTEPPGTNLGVSPQIYYPFTSSVNPNVIVPVPVNTTAELSSTTYKYSWGTAGTAFALSYTTQSTYTTLSGTSTVTATDSSSSALASIPEAAQDSSSWFYANASNVLGKGGLGVFPPGGFLGTSFDGTSSTVDESIRGAYETSSLSGGGYVEAGEPVFEADTFTIDPIPADNNWFLQNIVSFSRNA